MKLPPKPLTPANKYTSQLLFPKKLTITFFEDCTTLLQQELPLKLKDPDRCTISCTIEKVNIDDALCDLEASINFIPSLSTNNKI